MVGSGQNREGGVCPWPLAGMLCSHPFLIPPSTVCSPRQSSGEAEWLTTATHPGLSDSVGSSLYGVFAFLWKTRGQGKIHPTG